MSAPCLDNVIYQGWHETPTFPAVNPLKAAQDRVNHLRELTRLAYEDIERKQKVHEGYEACFYDWNPCKADDLAYAADLDAELAEAEEWMNVTLPGLMAKDGEQ